MMRGALVPVGWVETHQPRIGSVGLDPSYGTGDPLRGGVSAMEQIYYTQCPIGYGLGASNGFQIKRVTPGYPLSGDFRHLGLRAFLGGSRALAPPALRYRRDERGAAEVAFLTPRS